MPSSAGGEGTTATFSRCGPVMSMRTLVSPWCPARAARPGGYSPATFSTSATKSPTARRTSSAVH